MLTIIESNAGSFWDGVLASLVAAILFSICVFIATYLVNYFARSKLHEFFCGSNNFEIRLFLSNIRVQKYGSIGVDGKPRSYVGDGIPFYEYSSYQRFVSLFNWLTPKIDPGSFGVFNRLIFNDIVVIPTISPNEYYGGEKNQVVIAIGSPGYNAISGFIESLRSCETRFVPDALYRQNTRIKAGSDFFEGDVGLISKITHKSVIYFYLAGPSIDGTNAAVKYICSNWKHIHERYCMDDFWIIVRHSDCGPPLMVKRSN